MILSHQTGSYDSVLPHRPSDSADVVYLISNTDPPKSILNFQQLPVGIEDKIHIPRPFSSVRRSNLGDLVAITKDNRANVIEAGNNLFYAGQTLDFSSSNIIIIPVNSAVETIHDQYYMNGGNIGLDDATISNVATNAESAQKNILEELGNLQKQVDDTNAEIVSQQKILNEANRMIDGLNTILEIDPSNQSIIDIKNQVEQTKSLAEEAITIATIILNKLPNEILARKDQLRKLSLLVK